MAEEAALLEIRGYQTFEAWLRKQPREVAVTVTQRGKDALIRPAFSHFVREGDAVTAAGSEGFQVSVPIDRFQARFLRPDVCPIFDIGRARAD